jgi:hypothetical protein
MMRDNNDEHPDKHSHPKNVTEFGMMRDDNDEHREKHPIQEM